jgi:Transposase DDE domain
MPAETRRGVQDPFVTTDLDTLATALYVRTDHLLKESPQLAPWRPAAGRSVQLSEAELVTLAVMQALLGFTSEARWVRRARVHLRHLFPYLPQQPGYNKRLRAARGLVRDCARVLAASTSLWSDDVWVVDSTPVECARSRETVRRSELAGWAQYGYCASHSRWFWGLRLHLVTTLHGLPVGYALAGAKADERLVLLDILSDEELPASPGQVIIGDKGYYGRDFEKELAAAQVTLLRPARKGEPNRPAASTSSRCGRSSSPSTTPSKASSTASATAAAPSTASPSASCSASSPSPPPSGPTTPPDSPSCAH